MDTSESFLVHDFDSLSYWKKKRTAEIIKVIMMNGDLTRFEIANLLGLAMPSVIKYTQMLVNAKVLRQYTKNHGRQLTFGISDQLGYVLAVIVGRTIQARVVDGKGTIVYSSSKVPFVADISPEAFMETIDIVIKESLTAIKEQNLTEKDIFSIGLAIGGSIDPEKGISYNYYSSKKWDDFCITGAVTAKYGKFTFMMNDVNAAILGEKSFGVGKPYQDLLLVWLGEGTGMGIIINGELYEGYSYSAGEIAHMKVSGAEGVCYCGNVGCLETLTTESSICHEYVNLMNSLSFSSHGEGVGMFEQDKISYSALVDMANSGNKLAQLSFKKAIDALVDKISDISLVINPQCIVFRGSVIDGNMFMFERMKYLLNQRILNPKKDVITYIVGTKKENGYPIARGIAVAAILKLIDKTL